MCHQWITHRHNSSRASGMHDAYVIACYKFRNVFRIEARIIVKCIYTHANTQLHTHKHTINRHSCKWECNSRDRFFDSIYSHLLISCLTVLQVAEWCAAVKLMFVSYRIISISMEMLHKCTFTYCSVCCSQRTFGNRLNLNKSQTTGERNAKSYAPFCSFEFRFYDTFILYLCK